MYAQAFDRLFLRGRDAVLAGTHEICEPPLDGQPRFGISIIVRPDPAIAAVLATVTADVMAISGSAHWPTGAAVASHFTIRSLEPHREPIADDDAAVRRYADALARTSARRPGPIRFAMTGLTLTPTSVMYCAEPLDDAAGVLVAVLDDELGADCWFEADVTRDIWYANVVHFAGPIADPTGLVDWVASHRGHRIGETKIAEIELVRWAYDGRQAVPVTLARSAL